MALPVVDGIDLNDIMEASIGALALLASASMINKDEILELEVGPLIRR